MKTSEKKVQEMQSMQKPKKAQSEILGFAMVMILIVIGLAIFIRFSLSGESTDFINVFTRNELPLYLNNAMMETNIQECYGEKVSKLLIRCAEGKSFTCTATPNLFGPNGPAADSCIVAKTFISQTLNKTLDKNGLYYRYFAYTGDDYKTHQLFNITNDKYYCRGMNIPRPGRLFYRISGGDLVSGKLDICYQD